MDQTKSGITIETIDGNLDLADVSWQMIAPCGCVSGVHLAWLPEPYSSEPVVTKDQAARAFAETEVERKRDEEQGFTFRARERRAAVDELQTTCTHTPKWGCEPAPTPDGYLWAAVYKLGGRPKYTHLVPEIAVENAKERRYTAGRHKPLCGRGGGEFHWNDSWNATAGKVECQHCISAARRLAAA